MLVSADKVLFSSFLSSLFNINADSAVIVRYTESWSLTVLSLVFRVIATSVHMQEDSSDQEERTMRS